MQYEFTKKTPGIYLTQQIDQIEDFVNKKIKEISSSKNSRTIVLETWLIVDWFVRQLIISGINCLELQSDIYNPHYELLPNSFRECVDILKELKSNQEKLDPRPPAPFTGLKGDLGIWKFLEKESKEVYDKLRELEKRYIKEKHKIESDDFVILEPKIDPNKHRFVSDNWIDSVVSLDEKWFNDVSKLNKARNAAAHAYSDSKIYERFGITGSKKLELLREKCISLISNIIGLIPKKK